MNFFILLILNLLFVFSTAVFAEEMPGECKYIAIVSADRVNVRSGPGINFEVISQANKDEKCFIYDTKDNFSKVRLSEATPVWIYSMIVTKKDDKVGVVNKDGINIRAKPTVQSAIICQAQKGQIVSIIGQHFEWYKINAPSNAYGWIANEYLKNKMTMEEYKTYVIEKHIQEALQKVEQLYGSQAANGEGVVKYDEILSAYKEIIDSYPNNPKAVLAKERYSFFLEKKASVEMAQIELEFKEAQTKGLNLKEIFMPKYQQIMEKYPETQVSVLAKERLQTLGKVSIITNSVARTKEEMDLAELTGIVYDIGKFLDRPASHKLVKDGKIICFLRSDRHNLNDYIYDKVNVKGYTRKIDKLDAPIMDVREIKKINWKGRI